MRHAILLAFFSIVFFSFAFSELHPPRNLQGTFQTTYVGLQWNSPESDSIPSSYKIYRNSGWSFPSVIATVTDTTYNDNSIVLNTFYHYFVTAVYNSGQSEPSNIIGVATGNDTGFVRIMFTSTPPHAGAVNQLYSYTPTVTTDPSGVNVCFRLGDGPEGMTIDTSTGAIQWTPTSPGEFEVEIHARPCDGRFGFGEQEFSIMVFSGTPGSVNGTVTNDSGRGLPGIKIRLFDVSGGEFVLRTFTDGSGNYNFPFVNPSAYFVQAKPWDTVYAFQWFNNAANIEDATPVTVPPGTPVTVNFTLHHKDTTRFMLSGTVMDTNSNPLANAKLFVYHTEHDSTNDDVFDQDGDHDNGDRDLVRTLWTDSSGNYSTRLHRGTYIIGAKKEGYLPQFWNHEDSPLDADRLHLTSNTTGINFNLKARLLATGSIAGTIRNAADNISLRSHVVGFQQDAEGHFTGFATFSRSDTSGQYLLSHLPNGNYIVLAYAGDDFIPTFYNGSTGTPYLDSALSVSVTGGAVTGIDIYVRPDSDEGLNSIGGTVSANIGTQAAASSSPVAGAIVTVTSSDHVVVGSAISQTDGSYLVVGIAPGTYTTVFQKPGFTTASLPVTVSYQNNSPTTVSANAQLGAGSGGSGPMGTMSVHQRWNLVSVPVIVQDTHAATLFPGAISNAYGYNGSGYTISSVLNYGAGYWVDFPSAQVFNLGGTARTSETVTLTQGWNLIGSISSSVAVSSVATAPNGILSSDFFGNTNGGYAIASTIDPGQGYWVKANAGGTLSIASGMMAGKTTPQATEATSMMNSLTIRDASGNTQVLYFGDQMNSVTAKSYEMPPPGPDGSFNVTFASRRYTVFHPSQISSPMVFPIIMQTVASPVTVSWSIQNPGVRYILADAQGKPLMSKNMTGTGSVVLTSSNIQQLQLIASAPALPKGFSLSQNYPNPFNPSTIINYTLPAAVHVAIRVYNMLGQEIQTLVDGMQEAGYKSVTFNAANLPSGVYFYRIQAGKFVEVRKMLIAK